MGDRKCHDCNGMGYYDGVDGGATLCKRCEGRGHFRRASTPRDPFAATLGTAAAAHGTGSGVRVTEHPETAADRFARSDDDYGLRVKG